MVYTPIQEFRDKDTDRSSAPIRDFPLGKSQYDLSVLPSELSFNDTKVGKTSEAQTVVLINTGFDTLLINSIKAVGDFSIIGSKPTSIDPGANESVKVAFSPKARGERTGGLYINTGDATGEEFVSLSGSATGAASNLITDVIQATNLGTGTANHIQASTEDPVPVANGATLVSVKINKTNTSDTVLITFNKDAALTIKNGDGTALAISALIADQIIVGYRLNNEFRILTNNQTAGILALIEDGASRAEDARDTALDASDTAVEAADTATDKASEAEAHAQAAFEISTGVVLADEPTAIAGINNVKAMTALGVRQADIERKKKRGWVQTSDYVTNPVDSANVTAGFQAALDTGYNVEFTPGNYEITTTLTLQAGQKVRAGGGKAFSADNTKRNVKITNNTVGGGVFQYTSILQGQVGAPDIQGFELVADYPITLNDPLTHVFTGGNSPFLMQPIIKHNTLRPRVNGVGTGIRLTKTFNMDVRHNNIQAFNINILLIGCDIGSVCLNRSLNAWSFHILEISTGTFGSQVDITKNDILGSGSANCVFVKTSGRHVRVYDNYLEVTSGSLKGFIDLSPTGTPVYGSNTPSTTYSIFCVDNRIDGMHYATDFVYRLKPTAVTTCIRDSGTTGSGNDTLGLVIEGDGLPVLYNTQNSVVYDIVGERFGAYRAFRTENYVGDGLPKINAKTLTNFRVALNSGSAYLQMRFVEGCIALLSTFTATCIFEIPTKGAVVNPWFRDGAGYRVKVIARTTSASGDTLRIGAYTNGGTNALTNLSLTTQSKAFYLYTTGSAATVARGVYFTRNTANGTILIESIEFEEVLYGFKSFDFPEVAAGSSATTTVPVLGVQPGDLLGARLDTSIGTGKLSAYCVSADVATVLLENPAGGSNINPANALLRVFGFPR